jgi:dihydropyrimidinase
MTGRGELDARGLLLIPGGIDAHVHLVSGVLAGRLGQQEPVWVDDFWTGSLAAIAGGITTIGNMSFALPGESISPRRARS